MPDSAQSFEAAENRRFRPRFRLRSFLVVVTIFCVWLGWHIHGTRRQRDAVAAIRNVGGEWHYSYEVHPDRVQTGQSWVPALLRNSLGDDFFHPVVAVGLDKETPLGRVVRLPVSSEWTKQLPKVWYLAVTDIIDDEDLENLSRLKSLKILRVYNAQEVTDAGIVHLTELRDLEELRIHSPHFTDATLETLSQLPNLERLSVTPYRLTDVGVVRLGRLKRLRVLDLSSQLQGPSDISDKGLEFVLQLPEFNELNVKNTRVSDGFIEKVQEQFPKCMIVK